ncbi:MAG: DUF1844 domain-containing protein [Acidobacteria bacterium]|nr:DUF1844 domain-containing protein [Acidobacteriota bacterium]
MDEKDEKDEEVQFKVADRRKFNPDGTIREGVVLDEAPPKREEEETNEAAGVHPAPANAENTEPQAAEEVLPPTVDAAEFDEEGRADEADIPGADDPASFVNFLSTLASNAAISLGAMPHPSTGRAAVDLDTGKYWLDVLGMIRDKTKGNLHPQEARLIEGLLADLRMQYVHLVKATEEKLKTQAAKRFSSDEILGKK